MISSYQKEQENALVLISGHLDEQPVSNVHALKVRCQDYLQFREGVDHFLSQHFSGLCTRTCYENSLSACCSRDGIITFFADMVINDLFSESNDIKALLLKLRRPNMGRKCVYLGPAGCLWRIKPIVCEMFICDRAKSTVFNQDPFIGKAWEDLESQRKRFTWPDRPILFDNLESHFIDAGHSSPLMYLHNSPGLLKVKQNAKKRT